MIVTIDGPAGAGKSSVARRLADRLGYRYLDTGAMYRAVTLAALRAGIDLHSESALTSLLTNLTIDMPPGQVLLNGEDVTGLIRSAEITEHSGPIANSPAVRQKLVEWQRQIGNNNDIVCEGRDQGTIVFPDAGCKFFLVARPEERARRRFKEMAQRGDPVTEDEVYSAIVARDRRDEARNIAPMKPAVDAILLDSTPLSLEQVVEAMHAEVLRRQDSSTEQADS